MKVINFEKRKMILLTKEQWESMKREESDIFTSSIINTLMIKINNGK